MKCAPEWPPRESAHKERLQSALQVLRDRHRKGEGAAFILKAYSRPQEGLKLSALKLFLRPDHRGPVPERSPRYGRGIWSDGRASCSPTSRRPAFPVAS